MPRIGFLWFPFFHWTVYRREHPLLSEEPLILVREGRVVGVSPGLSPRGLVGLTPAKALGRCPEARLADSDPLLCHRASEEYLQALMQVSPVIEPRGEEGAFFDLSGCDAKREMEKLRGVLRERELGPAVVGLGRSKFIARAAALVTACSKDFCSKRSRFLAVLVEPGKEADFLKRVPLDQDENISPEALHRLAVLGFQNYGQLRELEEEKLARILGKEWYGVWRHSRGLDTEPLLNLYPPEKVAVSLSFEGPVEDRRVIDKALKEGAEQLSRLLRERRREGRTLRIVLKGEERVWEVSRHVPWGCQKGDRLIKMLEALWEKAFLASKQAVTGLILEVCELEEEKWEQQDLFSLPSRPERGEHVLEALIQSLRDKFPHAVLPGLEIERRERVLTLWDPWRQEGFL